MSHTSRELVWIKHFLQELGVKHEEPIELVCDNQAAMHIASNPVFHERTKHIEVDCHYVREQITENIIQTRSVKSEDELADLFTNVPTCLRVQYICTKLGAYDIYAPA